MQLAPLGYTLPLGDADLLPERSCIGNRLLCSRAIDLVLLEVLLELCKLGLCLLDVRAQLGHQEKK